MKRKVKPIPELDSSPFAPVEMVDERNLSAADRSMLDKEEAVIESGRRTFVDVASALMRIRDYKDGLLYKEKYGSFESYCLERWEFGTAYALRLVDAARVVAEISPMGEIGKKPTNERQIRALTLLADPAARRDAWTQAVHDAGDEEVTGKLVSGVVHKMIKAGARRRTAERKKKRPRAKMEIFRDSVALIRKRLAYIRKLTRSIRSKAQVAQALTEIESLLPEIPE